jgi:hypothetical protein
MSTAITFTALEDYLRAEWTATPIVFENETSPIADDPAAFVFVEIFGDYLAQETFGAPGENLWREEGEIRAHVLVPNGTGTRVARGYASDLADFFKEVEVSGIHFRQMSIGAGEPGRDDGNYYRMTLSIDWSRDQI